jgi:uncharacterized protein (DUF983 family)
MNNNLAGINIKKPCIKIKHSGLTRYGDSYYKSSCPACKEGILLVYRNPETLVLERYDRCILCGQQFEYMDIEDLRKVENHE